MMRDLRRICESPTEEDRRWFPDIAGSDWIRTLDFAMKNFKDESFIAQFLSPKAMRDLRLFAIIDDDRRRKLEVTAIHDDAGYRAVRRALADHYNLGSNEPDIQVYNVDRKGNRSLTLRHTQHRRRPLHTEAQEVLRHVARLWGFTVRLETIDEEGRAIKTWECDPPGRPGG